MARRRLLFGLLTGAAMLAAPRVLLAQKTDVVVLNNGDTVTGEIKGYSQGRLSLDTDHSGVISIKWSKIVSIASDKQFDIETTDGIHHFGSFAPSDPPGELVIVSEGQKMTIGFLDVFDLAPVFQGFWRRWDGSVDFGFNYTNSTDLTQLNLDADASYRVRNHQLVFDFSTFYSEQEGAVAADRGAMSFRYDRFLKNRWLIQGGVAFERNIQLGLKLRTSVGAGLGRYVVQTNQAQLIPYAGLLLNYEQPVEGEGGENVEGLLGARYSYFMYDFPKLTISASVDIYPSFTVSGRVRVEADASVRREIVSDFYMAVSIYDSYDSKDPTTQLSRNDWGPTISVGYSF
ncbi:MAG TPA: DUF481 domain-containing protein [Thermoanaerobaculia bacterium]|jgi:hypothetical protein